MVTMVIIKYFNEWRAQGGLLLSLIVDKDTIFYIQFNHFWFGFATILLSLS